MSVLLLSWVQSGSTARSTTASRIARPPRACRSAAHRARARTAHRMTTSLVSCSKPTPGRRHVVGHDEVRTLCGSACRGRWLATSNVSAANPTSVCPGGLAAPSAARISAVGTQLDARGRRRAFLILWSATSTGREVGDRGGHDHDVGRRGAGACTASCISAAVSTGTRSTPSERPASSSWWYERDLGAAGRGLLGHGVALLARERLPMNRTGSMGSRVPPAVTRTLRPVEVAGRDRSALDARRRSSSGAARRPAPTSPPARRPDSGSTTMHAAAAQRGEVVLHRRVLPHLGVHRRADDHRSPGGEQRGRQQVVASSPRRRPTSSRAVAGATTIRSALWPSGCAGSGRPRRTATSAPARRPAPRRWSRRRTAARPPS